MLESDTAQIERTGNVVTCKGRGKRYLVLAGYQGNFATTRTQRWLRVNYDGTGGQTPALGYTYARNGSNSRAGVMILDAFEVPLGNDIDVDLDVWRGDGVAADQGGADVDGGLTTEHVILAIVELPDDVAVWRSHDDTGLVDLTGTTAIDHTLLTSVVDVNSGSSFQAGGGAGEVECLETGRSIIWANLAAARNNVGSAARFTGLADIKVAGVTQTLYGDDEYSRGNQGTVDTFGWSASPGGAVPVTAGDDILITTVRITGGEAGGTDRTQPDWSHLLLIDCGSFASSAPAAQVVGVGTAFATWSGVTTQPLPGGVAVDVQDGVSSWSAVALQGLPGGVLAGVDVGAAPWMAVAVGVTTGITVGVDVGAAAWTAVEPGALPGGVSVGVDTAGLAWLGAALEALPGAVVVGVDIGNADWVGVAAAVSTNVPPQVVGVDVAAAVWAAQVVEVLPGGVSVGASTAAASWVAVEAPALPGGVSVGVEVGSASWAPVALTATPGGVSVSVGSAGAVWSPLELEGLPGEVLVGVGVATATYTPVDALGAILDFGGQTWLELGALRGGAPRARGAGGGVARAPLARAPRRPRGGRGHPPRARGP